MADKKLFDHGAACGYHRPREGMYGEGDSIQQLLDAVPEELHVSVRWLVARTGLYGEMRFLETCQEENKREREEEPDKDPFTYADHVVHQIAELIGPVAGDIAKCLGMVFHGVWDEIPAPYSTIVSFQRDLGTLFDAGILILEDNDRCSMLPVWQRYWWLRGRFVFGEKPYDLTQDWHLNKGIYEYPLTWCKEKPPGWEEYLAEKKAREEAQDEKLADKIIAKRKAKKKAKK